MAVKAIPDGYYSLTPYLVCKGAAKAIDYYTKVFGAKETVRMPGPGGHVMHAELKIGNSMLMLSDENKERGHLSPETIGGTATSIMLYTDDVDAVFNRAVAAGAKSETAAGGHVLGRSDGERRRSVRPQVGDCHAQGRRVARRDAKAHAGDRHVKYVGLHISAGERPWPFARTARPVLRRSGRDRRWGPPTARRSECPSTIRRRVRPDTADRDRRARSASAR